MRYQFRHEDGEDSVKYTGAEDEVGSLIRKALLLIERGWCRGARTAAHPEGGHSYCIRGALFEAYFGDAKLCESRMIGTPVRDAEVRIAQYIEDNDLDSVGRVTSTLYITRWNDDPYRTKDQVLEALRGAAG